MNNSKRKDGFEKLLTVAWDDQDHAVELSKGLTITMSDVGILIVYSEWHNFKTRGMVLFLLSKIPTEDLELDGLLCHLDSDELSVRAMAARLILERFPTDRLEIGKLSSYLSSPHIDVMTFAEDLIENTFSDEEIADNTKKQDDKILELINN